MQVAFVTDLHLQEDPGTGSVKAEQQRILEDIVQDIAITNPDLILLGGDNSGRSAPYKSTPAERNAHIWFRVQLAGIAPVIEVQGNHDYPGDYRVFNKLRTKYKIIYAEQPMLIDTTALFGTAGPHCVVACFPWIFSSVAGSDYYGYVRDQLDALIEQARILRDEDLDEDVARPYFVLGHCAIVGALVREGQPKVPTKDYTLDPKMLFPDHRGGHLFDAGFFGHYHHRQPVHHYGTRPVAVYGGSVFVAEYGESADKGWSLYDTRDGAFTFYNVRQSPKVEVIYDLEIDGVAATKPDLGLAGHDLEDIDFDELEVRLTVLMPDEGLEPYRERLREIIAAIGKTAMTLETKYKGSAKETTRKGAKAVAAATTMEDKIRKFLMGRPGGHPPMKDIDAAVSTFKKIRALVDARM